ncbi:MAG: hypothetical protein N2203_02320 [Bacteroidia bacterium]|nr:hypothetical protein [Bacteroidia bacterium]
MNYLKIIGVIVFLIFFAYVISFFSPDLYRKYDKPTIIFLLILYLTFYLIDWMLEKKISPDNLAGKDLVFIILKFLIPISYVTIKTFMIDEKDRKDFLFHFLIYAVLFLIADTIVNYQIINKK